MSHSPSSVLSSPSTAPQGRFPVRIPIRMTAEERAVIGKAACALHLSISRYLVELATTKEAGTAAAAPAQLGQEDRARVQFLQALFQGAGEKIKAVLNSERFVRGDSEDIQVAKICLEEVLRLLNAIGVELGRRIR